MVDFCRPETEIKGLSECHVDVAILLAPTLFISAVLLCSLVKWWRIRGDHRDKRLWVRYPGHTTRWLITLSLIYFQILEFTEGIISGLSCIDGIYLQTYIPLLVSTLGSILSLIYYDFSETYNLPRLMLISLGYWITTFILKVLKLSALYEKEGDLNAAIVVLTWITTVHVLVLVLTEVYSLGSQVSVLSTTLTIFASVIKT